MKKSIYIVVVYIMTSCISNQLFAQETIVKTRTKSNQTNEKSSSINQLDCLVKIRPTDSGCSIVFDNAIVSPRDAASGLPTGKRMHKPVSFVVGLSDNSITEVTSANDMVSGQASVSKKSTTTPVPSNSPGNPIKGISVKGGRNPGGNQLNKIVVTDGDFSLPVDLTDGEYKMSISFTYDKIEMGTEDTKGLKAHVSGHFILEIDGGSCRSIRESGVSVKSAR